MRNIPHAIRKAFPPPIVILAPLETASAETPTWGMFPVSCTARLYLYFRVSIWTFACFWKKSVKPTLFQRELSLGGIPHFCAGADHWWLNRNECGVIPQKGETWGKAVTLNGSWRTTISSWHPYLTPGIGVPALMSPLAFLKDSDFFLPRWAFSDAAQRITSNPSASCEKTKHASSFPQKTMQPATC